MELLSAVGIVILGSLQKLEAARTGITRSFGWKTCRVPKLSVCVRAVSRHGDRNAAKKESVSPVIFCEGPRKERVPLTLVLRFG